MKYVHFIRGGYVVRVTVPPELRAFLGKRELVEKLGGDKKVAERNAHATIGRLLATIEDAREQQAAQAPTLSSIAKQYYQDQLEIDDLGRSRLGHDVVAGLQEHNMAIFASQLRLVASGAMTGEAAEERVGELLEAISSKQVRLEMNREDLIRQLARVELDLSAAIEARDRYSVAMPNPTSELLTAEEPKVAEPAKKVRSGGATLTEVVAEFHKERSAGGGRSLAPKTMAEHQVAARMFNEFMGGDAAIRDVSEEDVIAYKRALLQTPSRYTQRFPGLTLPQALKANQKRSAPYKTLDAATINMKWLSHLSTIFKWARNNGYIKSNPAAGVRVDEGKGFREPTRVPFDQDDLRRIFGAPLFSEARYGTKQWALLVALYTGARSSSEIARIRLSDFREERGCPAIMLSEATKNVHSKRLVPIHDDLVKLGLIDYANQLRSSGHERLFSDWEPEDKINRWFLRSFKAEVGIDDQRKVFHSFRHTLKTALAGHGIARDLSDLITGHKDQTVAGVYIADQSVTMIQAMHGAINRVKFDLPIVRVQGKGSHAA